MRASAKHRGREVLLLASCAFFMLTFPAQASEQVPAPPSRLNLTQYVWLLVSRLDNKPLCEIPVGHTGPPTFEELAQSCGADLAQQWQATAVCSSDVAGNVACSGVDLRMERSQAAGDQQPSRLPATSVRLELVGCSRGVQAWLCDKQPLLRFAQDGDSVDDPIEAIHIAADGQKADCQAATCEIPLPPTDEAGIEVAFRFTTAAGASSMPESARVRVSAVEGSGGGGGPAWQVEILSPKFKDIRMDRCGLAWDSLPPLRDRPGWLEVPDGPEGLHTNEAYAFLEERLAATSLLTAEPGWKVDERRSSDPVSFRTGTDSMIETWQNQFDVAIAEAASVRGLPSHLLKGLIAQESQFWPGSFPEAGEVGLGHMSELGADNLLLWSPPFYEEFCPRVLHADTCKRSYSRLPEEHKRILRSALLGSVNSDCADCSHSLDLDKAAHSVDVFAESLVAYCSQTGRMVYNVARRTPGLVSTYEDLWSLTLANYNAGSGCLANALTQAKRQRQPLDWDHVAAQLSGNCQRAIEYVSKVLGEAAVEVDRDVGYGSSMEHPDLALPGAGLRSTAIQ